MNFVKNVGSLIQNQPTIAQFVNEAQQWQLNNLEAFTRQWKYSACKKMFSKNKGQVDQAMATLDIQKHSLALSYIIGFKACEEYEDVQAISQLLRVIRKFLNYADGNQICIAPRATTDALRFLVSYMKKENRKGLIPVLKSAIVLLQGNKSKNELTYAHAELMECCVHSCCYNMAFPEISTDIISVQGRGCVESFDNLRYHYYGACVFIGLKEFDKALEFLTMVCTAPSEAISVIQIAAYKKYVLVSLISKKQLTNLPRYTPSILRRYFNKFCSNYTDIANTFNSGKGAVVKLVEKNSEVFLNDNNLGLVKQVLNALDKHAVTKLTSVYTRLSIERVAQLCQFESSDKAKRVVISMIQKGELSATIDHQGVVKFEETISKSDSEMLKTIHTRIKTVMQLWDTLDKSQLDIKQNPDYIKKVSFLALSLFFFFLFFVFVSVAHLPIILHKTEFGITWQQRRSKWK